MATYQSPTSGLKFQDGCVVGDPDAMKVCVLTIHHGDNNNLWHLGVGSNLTECLETFVFGTFLQMVNDDIEGSEGDEDQGPYLVWLWTKKRVVEDWSKDYWSVWIEIVDLIESWEYLVHLAWVPINSGASLANVKDWSYQEQLQGYYGKSLVEHIIVPGCLPENMHTQGNVYVKIDRGEFDPSEFVNRCRMEEVVD